MNGQEARAAQQGSITPAIAALVAGAIAMGVSTIFVRLTYVGPQASAFWRTALALPLLWLWMRFEERDPRDRQTLRIDR
jgi:drug/metabolite transporter (DMT)-like permease